MNECCEHNSKCRWAVGSNMPGYMPDNHVEHFANYRDALRCFASDVERALDDLPDDEQHRYTIERAALKRWQSKARTKAAEHQVRIGDYVYWVSRV